MKAHEQGLKARFFRAFTQQPDTDAVLQAVSRLLDATGQPFLVFVAVGEDARVAGGPAPEAVVTLIDLMEAKGTLMKVGEEFRKAENRGKKE